MRVLSGSMGLDGPERCGRPVSDLPARLAGVVTAGLVLRTLADHRPFTLRAFWQACDRSVLLDHQACGSVWVRRGGCGGGDLNPRPSGYEPDELPDCSTPRHIVTAPGSCGQRFAVEPIDAGGTCCSWTSGGGSGASCAGGGTSGCWSGITRRRCPDRAEFPARAAPAYRPIHHCIVVVTSSLASCCTK